MNQLIEHALQQDVGKYSRQTAVSTEELELFVAVLNEEVSERQAKEALGRSQGFFTTWMKRCLYTMWLDKRLEVTRMNGNKLTHTYRINN